MDRLFEEIVATICSTQDLGRVFHDLQQLLRAHSKIEGIFLGHHMPDARELYHLAYADSRTSHILDSRRPADDELHDYLLSTGRREMNVFTALGDFPAMARTLASHIPEQNSLYELRVRLDGTHIGMLAFHTPEPCLSNEMLDLLMKIRAPIALALANRLRALSAWPGAPGVRPGEPGGSESFHIHGSSAVMRSVYRTLHLAAPTDSTVLLTGETGVGKDVYARYVHALSPRKGKPFVHVNCGGIAEALIDSELFGHKKGAFTGALADHAGFFEQAAGGTVFLDEIGELPLPVQARLLLVLQDKTIRRVGDTRVIPLDIRIIAATNCDIGRMCREGRFRKDLYYRLSGIPVEIPPLRERKEDIPALAEQFLRQAAREAKRPDAPAISPQDMAGLVRHDWPGNVRELENCIRRSFILSGGGILRMDIPLRDAAPDRLADAGPPPLFAADGNAARIYALASPGGAGFPQPSLADGNRMLIEQALRQAGGRVHGPGGAAELLGIHPSTLRSRMRKLGILFGRSS